MKEDDFQSVRATEGLSSEALINRNLSTPWIGGRVLISCVTLYLNESVITVPLD